MNTLQFHEIIKLSDHFEIPADETTWNHHYATIPAQGKTPSRGRASFKTPTSGLVPKTIFAESLKSQFGIYVVAIEIPCPVIYIGIAAGASKSPEGVLSRIRKHRVKITGSHVGQNENTVGGVNHTKGWRTIAPSRYQLLQSKRQPDTCEDVRLRIGTVQSDNHSTSCGKEILEVFESMLASKYEGYYKDLTDSFWPADGIDPVCLTENFKKLPSESELSNYIIIFE